MIYLKNNFDGHNKRADMCNGSKRNRNKFLLLLSGSNKDFHISLTSFCFHRTSRLSNKKLAFSPFVPFFAVRCYQKYADANSHYKDHKM